MAKREQTFLSKLQKGKDKNENTCNICGEPIQKAKFVNSVISERTGAWRFIGKNVKICKCNKKEIWG